jgi:peptidylprolyl isomerase
MKKTVLLLAIAALIGCSKSDSNIGKGPATIDPMSQSMTPPEPPKPPKPAEKHGDTTVTPSGLMYIDKKVGTGDMPKTGQKISVNYTGMLTNGKVFDSNTAEGKDGKPYELQIGVGQVIQGWDEGILSMKVGGKRRLIVPPELGYGAAGSGDRIPPNSVLVFDVELVSAEK